MNRLTLYALSLLLLAMPILASCQPVMPVAEAAPREVTVLAGAGQDTVAINAFFPASVRIRAGDTVTWQIGSDEPHTATFLSGEPAPPDPIPVPGGGPTDIMLNPVGAFPSRAPDAPVETYDGTGYRNSGFLSNGTVVPPLESYSLTFEEPGVYSYICLIHPATMVGEIIVEPATAADVPSQEEIDAQAQAEMEPLLAMAEETRAAATNPELVRTEPGPNGSTIWHVPAGMSGLDPRIEIYDFFPKDLTVAPGDTVIWTSTFFHQVIFAPGQPAPEFILPVEQAAGPPLLTVNPIVAFPAKPSGEFDGVSVYSSGLIGVPAGALPGGTTFALTFTEPGSYEYVCATHRPLGMTGAVNVVAQ
ncbi:MAG TPA: plastocyanin/azurin family copper-binding protein [Caldilineaceae bacterium]|nr:plastocyanin/azurin family copper-binding protein [Caldilineaceae bacterium]